MQGHPNPHPHDHDHPHDHGHDHHARDAGHGDHGGHSHGPGGHSHGPMNYDRVFAIGIALNVTYAAIEAAAGFWLNSLSLVADAGHNFSDVLGLLLAWAAVWLSRREPSSRHSYGLGRSSILAAMANAMLLFAALGVIVWESMTRFANPQPIMTGPVVWIATIGILINGFTAWLFMRGSKTDINVRGAYLHMVADAAVSLGVVVSALVMAWTGWLWLDPLTSLIIAAVIAVGSWRLLVDSVRLSLDGVPPHIDAVAVSRYLAADVHVKALHDLHIWALSTETVALTAHVVCPNGHPGDAWLTLICDELSEKYDIDHATIQVETTDEVHAKDAPVCGISFST
ncbi:MAG: cation diffusion facilitator family transporter [Casimicrobium sp.]|jgi:cobalt-zinc-cadmium efflux system protein